MRIGLVEFLLILAIASLTIGPQGGIVRGSLDAPGKPRKMPALPCLAGLEILLSMLLFTRIQNTGSHQMLLFLPGWFLLFLLGAAALAEGISRFRAAKVVFWVFTLVFATSVRCSPLTTIALPGFLVDHFPLAVTEEFVRLDKLIYDRKDLPQIKAIANWIDTHCAEGEISYMIPHDMLYCPDHFKNCQLPATPINDNLAFGFSVPAPTTSPCSSSRPNMSSPPTPSPRPLWATARCPTS